MAPGVAHCGMDTDPYFEAVVSWLSSPPSETAECVGWPLSVWGVWADIAEVSCGAACLSAVCFLGGVGGERHCTKPHHPPGTHSTAVCRVLCAVCCD
jgi:hypothetical protein